MWQAVFLFATISNNAAMINLDDRLIKEVSPQIGPNALSVLLAIAIHLNQKTNRCFPSHDTLMRLTGIGRDAVYAALKRLQDAGLLNSEQSINTQTKQFGRRTFRVSTRFIKIFVDAQDVEPLPEIPYTAFPDTGEPYTANPETEQINHTKQINNLKQIKNTRANALPVISINLDASWSYPELAQQAVGTWMEYKKAEKKGSYKTQKSFDIALNQWKKMSNANGKRLLEIVEHSISQGWSGLYIPKDYSTQKFTGGPARPADQPARYTPPPAPNPAELKEPKYRPL